MGQPERVLSSTGSPRAPCLSAAESAMPCERPGRRSAQPLIEPPCNPTSAAHQPLSSGQYRRGKRQMEFATFCVHPPLVRQSRRVPAPRCILWHRCDPPNSSAPQVRMIALRRRPAAIRLGDSDGVLVVNPEVGAPPVRRRMLSSERHPCENRVPAASAARLGAQPGRGA